MEINKKKYIVIAAVASASASSAARLKKSRLHRRSRTVTTSKAQRAPVDQGCLFFFSFSLSRFDSAHPGPTGDGAMLDQERAKLH